MKFIFILFITFFTITIQAQDTLGELQAPKKNIEAKMVLGTGFNLPIYFDNNILNHPYDLAQKSNTLGVCIHLGGAVQIKNRIGFEFTGGFNVFSFRRKYFDKNFQSRMGNLIYSGNEEQDVTNSGGDGMNITNLHPKIYFIANPKANNKFVPIAGIQFTKFYSTNFQYALRDTGTNYFSIYTIEQTDFKMQPLFSFGAELRRTFAALNAKGQIMNSHIAMRLLFLYGKYDTSYDITIRENNSTEYTLQSPETHTLFYTTLEVSITLFGTH